MSLSKILTTDDIFENIISSKDVLDFFREHQKRLAEKVLNGEDYWIFQSSNCKIKCRTKEKGNLPRPGCIGCVLSCRLTRDCSYPGFASEKKIVEVGDRMIRFTKKEISERDILERRFVNNSILTYFLDDFASGGAILFCYECDNQVILIEEFSNSVGFGFNGIIRGKRDGKIGEVDIQKLLAKIDAIDKKLEDENFILDNFKETQIAIINSPCNEEKFSFKIHPRETDGIISRGQSKQTTSIKKIAESKRLV